MDLNQITAAHRVGHNQFLFDQEAFDRAVLIAEKQHQESHERWNRLANTLRTAVGYLQTTTLMAFTKST